MPRLTDPENPEPPTDDRNSALEWLINERGLTYATGMAVDEYVAAAGTAAERQHYDGAVPMLGLARVRQGGIRGDGTPENIEADGVKVRRNPPRQ